MSNQELIEPLNQPIIRNIEKGKVHSPFTHNVCNAAIADMELINKLN